MDTINLQFVRPDRVLYQGEVAGLTLVTPSGELGVWPQHDPQVVALGFGEVRLNMLEEKGGGIVSVMVSGGYAEIENDNVIILADSACRADQIEVEAVRSTREAAMADLAFLDNDDSRRAYYENKIRWCDLLLKHALEEEEL